MAIPSRLPVGTATVVTFGPLECALLQGRAVLYSSPCTDSALFDPSAPVLGLAGCDRKRGDTPALMFHDKISALVQS